MKQIRQSVFETNSSSTHSISIAEANPDAIMDSLRVNDNGIVEIEGSDFGWEYEKYRDAQSKAGYAMIYALDWAGADSERYQSILKDVIKKQTGADSVEFVPNGDTYHPYGYIDHQSVEGRDLDYMFEEPELLRQFIFNGRSILITDNDNH